MVVTGSITTDPRFQDLCARLSAARTPVAAHGLWGSSAPMLAAALARSLGRPLLYLTAHFDAADDARDDMETTLGAAVDMLPAWETLPGEGAGADEIATERARLCAALHAATDSAPRGEVAPMPPRILTAPLPALMQPVPSPASLEAHSLVLSLGQEIDPRQLVEYLVDRGMQRLDQVEEPGDFALRGGILDLFTAADLDPVRIEFFGDQVESIRQFEVGTQRSMRSLERARITLPPDPQRLRPADLAPFTAYLPDDTLVVLEEPVEMVEIGRAFAERLEPAPGHATAEEVLEGLRPFGQLHLTRFPAATVAEADTLRFGCAALETFEAKATDAVAQLLDLAGRCPVVVYCDNQGEADRLAELIREVAAGSEARAAAAAAVGTHIGLLHRGFAWHGPGGGPVFAAVPHHDLFRRYSLKRRMRRVTSGRPIESFLDLSEGDYVVHVLHGIAQYAGMKTMRKGDSKKLEEYLTLRFADSATLHVPVSQIDLVQKYIGARSLRPPLSKLGGTRWQTTKARVEEAVTDLASDLLRIQVARESQPGIAFPHDTHWQTEFENAFLYTETPDQVTALGEIKSDMARDRPMDRLLCGDVGYGKTELAMRAAFKVAEFGRQVAVLVPTTLLAEQHFRTFTERMADYPFQVACLNRFRSPKEQREILGGTRKGQVDILIGTHRLLSRDVAFADLGLVVVDEEQRFGVEHKERLKHLRATVDVLTLTATPIPRTLHMAMIGLRDISSLSTPPLDRRAIATTVCAWSDDVVREAILRELAREGQVYFVHNRVQTIESTAARVRGLVPGARILVGHGQMPGDDLEEVMARFVRREADILVSTAIIESGLDIPNANTILIDRADTFGLADLHQLRGRVGRYKHRAYCYLLLSPNRPITSTAAKRLKAIEQYTELGAGFRIAMRDLEIRGAGNILGPEQSGNIAAVGYELYCQLLEQGVRRMRGEPVTPRVAVHLELDVEAYLPQSYIPSDRQRMEGYRRLAAARTPQDVEQVGRDLEDAFGRLPPTAETLLTLADIKVRAAAWNIRRIIKREPDVIFTIEGEVRKLEPLFARSKGTVQVPDGRTLHWRLPDNYFHGETFLRILRNLFREDAAEEPAAAPTPPAGPPRGGRGRARPPVRPGRDA